MYRTYVSIPQRLSGFQGEGDAFLGLLFAAEGDEGFALEVEDVLFANQLRRSQRAAGQDVGELAAHVRIVFGGVSSSEHHVDGEFRAG